MKKLVSIIIVVILTITSLSLFSYATEKETNELDMFIENTFYNSSDYTTYNLLNNEERTIAELYLFEPVGYMVLEKSKNIVVEFSTYETIEFNETSKFYYGGPLNIFSEYNGKYVNILSGNEATKDEVTKKVNSFIDKTDSISRSLNADKTNDSISLRTTTNYINRNFKLYRKNTDGRCGSVAAAILLAYYNDYGYSGLVPSAYYNNELTFTNYLKPHIEDVDGNAGATVSELKSGLNWYINNKGFSSSLTAYSRILGLFISYKNRIDNLTPVCISVSSEPTYGDHWVVGYGYRYESLLSFNNKFATVNDGWGHMGREINWDYVNYLVYVN